MSTVSSMIKRISCALGAIGLFAIVPTSRADQPQQFLVFDSAVTPQWIQDNGNRYVFVWGASANTVDTFNKYSPRTRLSTYFPYMRDPDKNTTITQWDKANPTWVVYHCDGKTPVKPYNDSNITLDVTNPIVVQWQVANFVKGASRTGIAALDNVQFANDVGACGIRDANGKFKRLYTNESVDPAFAGAVASWVKTVSDALHAHGIRVVVNHVPDEVVQDGVGRPDVGFPPMRTLLDAVDGMVDEHTNLMLRNEAVAKATFEMADYAGKQKKWMYFIYQMNDLDAQAAESAMAAYLAMSNEYSAIYVSNRASTYGRPPQLFGYERNIGHACGQHQELDNVVTRKFTGGMAAFALPGDGLRATTIPSGYKTVTGQSVSSTQQMRPGSGLVVYTSTGMGGCNQ